MKSWLCSTATYLNLTNNLCEVCQIEGCAQCLSLKACGICDGNNQYRLVGNRCVRCNVDDNFYLNKITMQCQKCDDWACPRPTIEKGNCNSLTIVLVATDVLPISCSAK